MLKCSTIDVKMKTTSFMVVFSVLFASTIAYPATDHEDELEKYKWIDELITSVLEKTCKFVCDDYPSYLEQYIPEKIRENLAKTGKDVTKAMLRYAFSN